MKKLTLILMFFVSMISSGQIKFETGYFILNSGKKIECEIKNLDWKNSPKEFEYRQNGTSDVQKIFMTEVSEFSISDNLKYKRFEFDIDISKTSLKNMSDEKEPIWAKQTHFLKVLIEGQLTLYAFNDVGTKFFYYSDDNQATVKPLVFKEYLVGSVQIKKNNYYKQQLMLLMGDANFPIENFNNLEYKQSDISALFVKYNKFKDPESNQSYVRQSDGKVNLRLIAGANFASTEFDIFGYTSEFEQKTVLKVGAELEYNFGFNKNKWAVFLDPNFQSYSAEADSKYAKFTVDYKVIELPVGVRHYMFLGKGDQSKLFVNSGFAYGFVLDSELIVRNEKLNTSSTFNLFLGIGYSYSKFSIELRHNFNRPIINYLNAAADYKSTGISVGYNFL